MSVAVAGRPDAESNPPVPASPGFLLALAAVVALCAVTAGVLQVVASYTSPHSSVDAWGIADYVLIHLASALYYGGVLVGLGTLATARPKRTSAGVQRIARLLLLAGVAVVVLAIVDVVCITREDSSYSPASWYVTSGIFSRLTSMLFYAGVLEIRPSEPAACLLNKPNLSWPCALLEAKQRTASTTGALGGLLATPRGIGPQGPRHWSPHVPVTEYEHLVLTLLSVSPDYSSILMALQSGWCPLATGGSGGIIMSGQQTPAEKGGAPCTED